MSASALTRVRLSTVSGFVVLSVGVAVWAAWATAPTLTTGLRAFGWPDAVMVAALYLCAHILRIARLLVILGDSAHSVRSVAYAHALTAPISSLTPLKLGEIFRIYAFGVASRGFSHGLRAWWIERTFDAAVLAIAGTLTLAFLSTNGNVLPVTGIAFAVLGATAIAISVLPENIGMIKSWLIRRYSSPWSVSALALLHELGATLRRSRELVQRKVATLAALTLLLWGLETAALTMLVGGVDLPTVLASMLTVLSDILRPASQDMSGIAAHLPIYRLVVFASVNAFALLALVSLARGYRRTA